MMSFQMTLMMGEDDDNVDDSGKQNAIDADNDNMNTYQSEGDVGGDTYDDGASEDNDVSVDHAAYTSNADNADVGSNANKYDKNDTNNDHANEDTKYGNNFVIDEVPILLMMGQDKIDSLILKNTCPVKILMDLRSRDVKLEMRMISSLA